jgi:bifunctional non-homologous end joining protein LigD
LGEALPLIVSGALKLPESHFVLDGEVVVRDKDGVSDFDALHSRRHDKRAMLYAFDLLAGEGEDLRGPPLSLRKFAVAQLLADPVDGIFIAEYQRGDIGDVLFRVACDMGIVSKRRDRTYGAGGCRHWIKVKNPAHSAYIRVRDKLLQSPRPVHAGRPNKPRMSDPTHPCADIPQ